MKVLDSAFLKGIVRMCEDGWQQGWHERNGGNLTYRIKDDEIASVMDDLCFTGDWKQMDITADGLNGAFFLSTGSGKYMRNVAADPEDCLGIVQLNETADAYRIVWGLKNGGKPTSELPTHLMNHAVRAKATNGAHRVIYHAHPANIIAMTNVVELSARAFSRVLWQNATECAVVFPGGVGVVEWMVPGGRDIALATCKEMAEYDAVVWAQHGLFVSGGDFDEAFGLMHTIEKAAQIYMISRSAGEIINTIPDEGLLAIAKEFGVTIRREFLNI